jgi:hypothetical protein
MASGGDGESAAAPLLEKKPAAAYYDGCPGCAVDRRKAESTGIPYKLFFHIWIINLVSCTCTLASPQIPALHTALYCMHGPLMACRFNFYARCSSARRGLCLLFFICQYLDLNLVHHSALSQEDFILGYQYVPVALYIYIYITNP